MNIVTNLFINALYWSRKHWIVCGFFVFIVLCWIAVWCNVPHLSILLLFATAVWVIALVITFLQRLKWIGAWLIVGLLMLSPIVFWQLGLSGLTQSTTVEDLTIGSFNTHQLPDEQYQILQLKALIQHHKPAVLCLQEFGMRGIWQNQQAVADSLSRLFGYPYVHYAAHPNNVYGLALCSQYPILQAKILYQVRGEMNGIVKYKLKIGQDTLQLVNLHLQSYNFKKDYHRLYNLIEEASEKRYRQIEILIDSASEADFLVGDFNLIGGSHAYQQLCNYWIDAGSKSPFFTHGNLPIRLDYLFTKKEWKASMTINLNTPISDHRFLLWSAGLKGD